MIDHRAVTQQEVIAENAFPGSNAGLSIPIIHREIAKVRLFSGWK